MLSLVYPPESFFYPYHLIAGIIAGLIYGVIGSVLWYVHSQRILKPSSDTNEKKDEENKQSLGRADAISLGTLILTLIASGLYPFLINPMLDYEISYEQRDNPKIETYAIDVKNWGLSPAKNVIFSLTSHNIRFLNFTSEPFLGNLTRLNSSVEGNALFSIPVLPPRSDTLIHFKADISNAKTDQRLVTFVRSDEKVGYHDVVGTIAFYLILGIIIVFAFIYMVVIKKNLTIKGVLKSMIFVFAWMVVYSLFYLQMNIGKF